MKENICVLWDNICRYCNSSSVILEFESAAVLSHKNRKPTTNQPKENCPRNMSPKIMLKRIIST